MKMLNLGCGTRLHRDWTNVDFVAAAPGVIACDLRRGVPFASGEFDVVYHSHMLEHFDRNDAPRLINECLRVLRPGGTIRVVVPDLEGIVRGYLAAMEQAISSGDAGSAARYDWMTLELMDQMIRERTGGEMLSFLRQNPVPEARFILSRCGAEARRIMEPQATGAGGTGESVGAGARLRHALRLLKTRHGWGEVLVRLAGRGTLSEAFRVGWFRRSGETHRWMYDRFSLGRLLTQAGFTAVTRRTHNQSAVPDWERFALDTEPDGSAYKPDSLYMEGQKPAS